jgi:hypothetical protein
MTVNFGDKLTLVLKILLVSRTRLAADLGVDKSIVSRWCSGANAPSGENLSQLTRLIGARVPGFTALDWDGDLATLARRLKMPPTDAVHSIPDDFAQWLETPALATAAAGSMTMSRACAGIWRTTRPFPAMPGHYIREYVLMQPRPGGLLRFRMGLLDVRIEGWSYCVGNQAFSCAINQTNGDAVFTIFHWRGSERAELIDGITLSPGGDPWRAHLRRAVRNGARRRVIRRCRFGRAPLHRAHRRRSARRPRRRAPSDPGASIADVRTGTRRRGVAADDPVRRVDGARFPPAGARAMGGPPGGGGGRGLIGPPRRHRHRRGDDGAAAGR